MRFFQVPIMAIAFVGWIIYQMAFKKKKIKELQPDLIAITAFIAVWAAIYYWAFK
jgi:hypothetical protein